jgi:hypothetical protein
MFRVFLYFYLTTIGLAFLASLLSFKYNYPRHLKLFSVLLGITFLVEITANFVLTKSMGLSDYRSALYNQFALFEFVAYAYFFYLISRNTQVKRIIVFFICLFPVLWIATTFFLFGYKGWNTVVITVGGYFTVLFALLYVYHSSGHEDVTRLSKRSEFWIAIGMVIFYSCQVPYLGMLNVLNKNYPTLTRYLLRASMVIDGIMYCFFIYAYLCRRKKSS